MVRAQDKVDLAGARAVLTAAGATVTERPERAQVAVLVVDSDPAAVLGDTPAGLPVVMVTPELTAEQAEPAARRHVVIALPKAAVTPRSLGAGVAAAARSAARPTASQLYAQYLHTVAEADARRRAQPPVRPATPHHRPTTNRATALRGTAAPGSAPGPTTSGAASPGSARGAASPGSARGAASPGSARGAASPGFVRGAALPGASRGAAAPGASRGAAAPGAPRSTAQPATTRPMLPAPAPAAGWMSPGDMPACELTERETTILRHVADGLDTEEIAAELGCSRRTVIKCVGDVMHRYGLHNRPHVIAFAIRAGAL
ncbi:LuxR C-terminal-related transcriptional regulator [Symbioplanes lichenis]|uniref:LuxR C-terminal-related transcriptional regulator n=1 Tax=Symbioplanes lichenis TaxID=1629072 RepID=UPI00273A551A|nr:LuxR C-terminal-related transcriptional regulator [Actinoplanes lichenis]